MDGVIKTLFRFTVEEQRLIIDKVFSTQFFSFPDTLYRMVGIKFEPDPSPDFLRIKYQNTEKRVVWFIPMDAPTFYQEGLTELTELIRRVIESKPEYKKLPSARCAYL